MGGSRSNLIKGNIMTLFYPLKALSSHRPTRPRSGTVHETILYGKAAYSVVALLLWLSLVPLMAEVRAKGSAGTGTLVDLLRQCRLREGLRSESAAVRKKA